MHLTPTGSFFSHPFRSSHKNDKSSDLMPCSVVLKRAATHLGSGESSLKSQRLGEAPKRERLEF